MKLTQSLLALALLGAAFEPTQALWAHRSFLQLIEEADDVVIFAVREVVGPDYGQKAIGTVEKSFKGNVSTGNLELPFLYSKWPISDGRFVTVGCRLDFSLDAGKRYLVMIRTRYPESGRGNPHMANTTYEIVAYPRNTLFELTGDDDPVLSEAAQLLKASSAEEGDEKLGLLAELLDHGDGKARYDAVEALGELDSAQATPLLLAALDADPDDSVRIAAATALVAARQATVTAALIAAVTNDRSIRVRQAAVRALAHRDDRGAIPALLQVYPSADDDLRYTILLCLMRFRDSSVLPILEGWFEQSTTPDERRVLLEVIREIGTAEAAHFAVSVLEQAEDPVLRGQAILALSHMGAAKHLDAILESATVPCELRNEYVLYALFVALQNLGTAEQIISLGSRYAACDLSKPRSAVINALKQTGSAQAIPVLEEMARNERSSARKAHIEQAKAEIRAATSP
jgi:HEAT repeat protein